MVTERELLDAIRECEDLPPSLQNCQKLAVFRFVYDSYFKGVGGSSDGGDVAKIPLGGGSEFLQAVSGRDLGAVLAVLDELMDSLKILQPRLYEAVLRRLRE